MHTKLTITVEEDVIVKAKRFAKKNGKSLSYLIENYLKLIIKDKETPANDSLDIMKLRGSIKVPDNFDYKAELSKAIIKKYSK
jgi:hypothetical protein